MTGMTALAQPIAKPAETLHEIQAHSRGALTLGALGVVFGDIGTSPLYAFQATLDPRYHLNLVVTDLYGIASLIFWSFVFVVTIKYVFIVMRCDNRGEGGSLALYSLVALSYPFSCDDSVSPAPLRGVQHEIERADR